MMEDTSLIRDIAPEARNLEGYMYPSTYSFPRGTKPETVVEHLVQQFKKVWKAEWTEAAKGIGKTPHQIVTIASLIETESGVESERPTVASVIYNRLSEEHSARDRPDRWSTSQRCRTDGRARSIAVISRPIRHTTRAADGGLPPGPISSVSRVRSMPR
jgi:UPF0755 protein